MVPIDCEKESIESSRFPLDSGIERAIIPHANREHRHRRTSYREVRALRRDPSHEAMDPRCQVEPMEPKDHRPSLQGEAWVCQDRPGAAPGAQVNRGSPDKNPDIVSGFYSIRGLFGRIPTRTKRSFFLSFLDSRIEGAIIQYEPARINRNPSRRQYSQPGRWNGRTK